MLKYYVYMVEDIILVGVVIISVNILSQLSYVKNVYLTDNIGMFN